MLFIYILVLLFLVSLGLSISSFVISNKHLNAKRGPTGPTGPQGNRGPQGPTGSQGEQGEDGKCPRNCKSNEWKGFNNDNQLSGKTFSTPILDYNKLYNIFISINAKQSTSMTINGFLNTTTGTTDSVENPGRFNLKQGNNLFYIPSIRPISVIDPEIKIEFNPPIGQLQWLDNYNAILYQEA